MIPPSIIIISVSIVSMVLLQSEMEELVTCNSRAVFRGIACKNIHVREQYMYALPPVQHYKYSLY